MNESAFTDVVFDHITDYILAAKAQNRDANVFECLQHVSKEMNYSLHEVTQAFGDIIKAEVDRANAASDTIDESVETFSKSLLTEAEKSQIAKKDINEQVNDKKPDVVKSFYVYANFNRGQMFIFSKTNEAVNIRNKSLEKLYNFLSTCDKPTYTDGILVAPITKDDALQYIRAGKVIHEDLTLRSRATSPTALAKEY